MAITYTKTIPEDKLCLAYNNNILEFSTDSTLDILNAQLNINGTVIVLYPHPNKRFYLNLKQYLTTFLNVGLLADNLDISSQTWHDWTNRAFLNTNINIKINFTNLSSENALINTSWLSGYLQLQNRNILNKDELLVMNSGFIKFWNGYPNDFCIYNPIATSIIYFKAPDGGQTYFTNTFLVTRFIFSDGILNFYFPDNREFFQYDILLNETETISGTIKMKVVQPKCDNGFYIKWINSLGGYSYWLFENFDNNLILKDLGEINNDYNNLEDTLSKSIQVGKTSQQRCNVTTDVIDSDEQGLLRDLFDSPKIYWFIGTPNEVNNFNDWTEISLTTTSIQLNRTKSNLSNTTLTFELPINDTRTI